MMIATMIKKKKTKYLLYSFDEPQLRRVGYSRLYQIRRPIRVCAGCALRLL